MAISTIERTARRGPDGIPTVLPVATDPWYHHADGRTMYDCLADMSMNDPQYEPARNQFWWAWWYASGRVDQTRDVDQTSTLPRPDGFAAYWCDWSRIYRELESVWNRPSMMEAWAQYRDAAERHQ